MGSARISVPLAETFSETISVNVNQIGDRIASNETEISCGEPEETIHEANSVDGRHAERKSQDCSPSASSIG